MNLKMKLKLNKLKRRLADRWYASMKPLAEAAVERDKKRWSEFVNKVSSMTEEEVIERLARIIIKDFSSYPKGYEDIHITKQTEDYTDRNIRSYMIERSGRDKYIKQYGYNIKCEDIDTHRRLTEMLYDRLSKEEVLDVKWKVYDNMSSYWKGYEKTLIVEVKKEYLDK